jgi:Holliday junction DNA helicase RuvA
MIYSLKGKVISVGDHSVAIEVNNVGYEVLVAHLNDFSLGQEVQVFTYEAITEDDHYLVGFTSKLEKEAFSSLISVKGIGPKTAINALKATTPDALFKAIAANNTAYLKKLPGIGPKAASQIILDLKGQLAASDEKGNPKQYDEVRAALKTLGFKNKDIDDTLANINEPSASNEEILRLALRSLGKGKK